MTLKELQAQRIKLATEVKRHADVFNDKEQGGEQKWPNDEARVKFEDANKRYDEGCQRTYSHPP